jgi:hypothetical protein
MVFSNFLSFFYKSQSSGPRPQKNNFLWIFSLQGDLQMMKRSAGRKNPYKGKGDRTQQEQVRKRRHNLFKRLVEFKERYEIDSWIIMKMPSGRIYTFQSTDESMPTHDDIVRQST